MKVSQLATAFVLLLSVKATTTGISTITGTGVATSSIPAVSATISSSSAATEGAPTIAPSITSAPASPVEKSTETSYRGKTVATKTPELGVTTTPVLDTTTAATTTAPAPKETSSPFPLSSEIKTIVEQTERKALKNMNTIVAAYFGADPVGVSNVMNSLDPLLTSLYNAPLKVQQMILSIVKNIVSLIIENYRALIENWKITISGLTGALIPIVAYYYFLEFKAITQKEPTKVQLSEKEKKLEPKLVKKTDKDAPPAKPEAEHRVDEVVKKDIVVDEAKADDVDENITKSAIQDESDEQSGGVGAAVVVPAVFGAAGVVGISAYAYQKRRKSN